MIEIQVLPFGGPPLVRDYLAGRPEAARFFNGDPSDLEAYRHKLAEVAGRFDAGARRAAAAALRPTSPRSAERLASFVEQGGAMVTTGQQAGLLGGHLYTLYKALTAVRLAGWLEERLEVAVLPVFWVASEDHDWEEASHLNLPSSGRQPLTLRLPERPATPLPMSEAPLGDGIRRILDEFSDCVGIAADGGVYLELVERCYRPDRTVSAAFDELMVGLLAPFHVLIADSADPALKRASAPILAGALERAGEIDRALEERSREIEAAGYRLQVPLLPDATHVFIHGEAGRERLHLQRGEIRGEANGVRLERSAAAAAVEREPERFSPNVLLRPVVESAVFPTLAYVAGPGEASYFAQAGALFGCFGIAPPLVYPRLSATLIDDGTRSRLERLGLTSEDAARPPEVLAAAIARAGVPAELDREMRELGERLVEGYRRVIEAAKVLDPSLMGAMGSRRNRSLLQLRDAERVVLRAAKRRESGRIEMLERALGVLRPGGQPQERVLNGMYFLCREGPSLLEAIAAAVPAPWPAEVAR